MFLLIALLFAQADGLTLLHRGHYPEARAAIEKAGEPLALAELRLAEQKTDEAAQLVERALAAKPNDAHAHYLQGAVLAAQIDSVSIFSKLSYAKRMKAAFERAAELDPDSAEAREALAEFYLRAPGIAGGSVQKARSLVAELIQIDPVRGYLERAQVALHEDQDPSPYLGQALKAARDLDERLRVLNAIAHARLQEKDAKGALEAAEEAISLDPGSAPPHFFAAEALGKTPRAKIEYETYLRSAPPTGKRAAVARERLKEI